MQYAYRKQSARLNDEIAKVRCYAGGHAGRYEEPTHGTCFYCGGTTPGWKGTAIRLRKPSTGFLWCVEFPRCDTCESALLGSIVLGLVAGVVAGAGALAAILSAADGLGVTADNASTLAWAILVSGCSVGSLVGGWLGYRLGLRGRRLPSAPMRSHPIVAARKLGWEIVPSESLSNPTDM